MSVRGVDNDADRVRELRSTKLQRLGKYRFIAEIGRGGMADVYLAVMEGPSGFSKLIAVKMLRQQFAEQLEGREMFLNEARLASRLDHPNVVSVLEVGEEDGNLFIAMEYLRGQPLSRLLARVRTAEAELIPLTVQLRILSEALAGLQHAHDSKDFDGTPLQLIHRDVTPHNIFVTYDGMVKVLDFGIAKAVSNSNETREGILKGKVAFMAPEQLMAESVIDRRVDIYAVGCCLWEIIAKRRPFKGMSDVALLTRVATKGCPAIREAVPDIPDELERICMKAVAFSAADRYQEAADFLSDLDAYIQSTGSRVTRKEIGKYLSDLFAEELERAQHVIETNLSKAALSNTADLASHSLALTGSGSWSSSNESSAPSASTDQSAALSLARGAGATPGRKAKLLVAGVVVGLVGAASVAFALRSKPPAEPSTGQPSATVAPESSIKLTLRAQPNTARLFVDGASVATNPMEMTVRKDGAKHTIRAEAPGHVEKSQDLIFDGDKEVLLVLEQAPVAAPSETKPAPVRGAPVPYVGGPRPPDTKATATATVAPPPTTAPTPAPTPTDKTKQKRQLDDDNPFEKK